MLGQSNSSTVINYVKLENQDITVTQNGVYEADERHTGLGKVTVDVAGANNQDKTVDPTTSEQTVTADEGFTGLGTVTITAVTNEIDSNIVAENIKSGVPILGVVGSYEVPEINNQDKTIAPSVTEQNITFDEGYTGLGTVTVSAVTNDIDSNIAAGNIKQGVTILGIEGTVEELNGTTLQVTPSATQQVNVPSGEYNAFVSVTTLGDENLAAENIAEGVTIFGVTGSFHGQDINNQDKSVTPATSVQSVTADGGYTGLGTVTVNAVTSDIDSNITAENIKAGVSVLGVVGSYEAPEPVVQEKTVNPTTSSQVVSPDEGYDALSSVTVNAVSSSIDSNIVAGNIKQGVTILGVEGTVEELNGTTLEVTPSATTQINTPSGGYNAFTSVTTNGDENLTAENIAEGVTIFGVTGSFHGGEDINNQDKTVVPSVESQSITADTGYTGLGTVTVQGVTASVDSNITAENIKSGVSVLGVEGTYEGAVINNKALVIESNGTHQIPEGYTGLGPITVAVPATAEQMTVVNRTGATINAGDKVWLSPLEIDQAGHSASDLSLSNQRVGLSACAMTDDGVVCIIKSYSGTSLNGFYLYSYNFETNTWDTIGSKTKEDLSSILSNTSSGKVKWSYTKGGKLLFTFYSTSTSFISSIGRFDGIKDFSTSGYYMINDVYAIDIAGENLVTINSDTGEVLTSYPIETPISTSSFGYLCVANDKIYVLNSSTSNVYSFDGEKYVVGDMTIVSNGVTIASCEHKILGLTSDSKYIVINNASHPLVEITQQGLTFIPKGTLPNDMAEVLGGTYPVINFKKDIIGIISTINSTKKLGLFKYDKASSVWNIVQINVDEDYLTGLDVSSTIKDNNIQIAWDSGINKIFSAVRSGEWRSRFMYLNSVSEIAAVQYSLSTINERSITGTAVTSAADSETLTVTFNGIINEGSGGDLVNATNETSAAITEGQKVFLEEDTAETGEKSYRLINFADSNETTLTGMAKTAGAIGESVEVLTILVESSETGIEKMLTKSGDVLVTKSGDSLVYKQA